MTVTATFVRYTIATVTADDLSKINGDDDPVLTATVTGTSGTDTLDYSLSRAAGETPGTYAITASGETVQGDYYVVFIDGVFTIYPRTFTVTFDMLGHGTAPDDQKVEEQKWAVRPADPSAAGYAFGGWYKDPSLTVLWDFPVDRITSDTVIYAKWTENPTVCIVSFNTMGHGSPVRSHAVMYGGLVPEPDAPAADGYSFGGWYKEQSCVTSWDFGTDHAVTDMTLYARWTKDNVPIRSVSVSIGSTIIGFDDTPIVRFTLEPADATP